MIKTIILHFMMMSLIFIIIKKIITLQNNKIVLEFENFTISINGENLKINKMNKCELLIKGNIKYVQKN